MSQGRAGLLAHSRAQSEVSHDFSVGVWVAGVGAGGTGKAKRREGGGSDFRIQDGNTKYICESQAGIHHMTP